MATCYKIGDIGPGGGLIFALPFTGVNQTMYYYEVLLQDINEGGGTQPLPIPPGCNDSPQVLIGSEFGANNITINTSTDFGDGKKNTDIISAVVQPPNGGVHPYIDSHDVAANQCKSITFGGLQDWFLPSYEEFREAATVLQASTLSLNTFQSIGSQGTEWWYLTSSVSTGNNAIAATVSQPSPTPGLSTQTLVGSISVPRCRIFSVRPIRRFVCKDKGIDYDYRLNFSHLAGLSPGVIPFLEPWNFFPIVEFAAVTLALNPNTTSLINVGGLGASQNLVPIGPGAITVLCNTADIATLTIGENLDIAIQTLVSNSYVTQSQGPLAFGPVRGIYPVNSTGSIIVFGNWNDATLSSDNVNPSLTMADYNAVPLFLGNFGISWTVTHPHYTDLVGYSNLEIGHQRMDIVFNSHDIRGNDMKALLCSKGPSYYRGEYFNFKFYDNFENLLIDIDYKFGPNTNVCSSCPFTQCNWDASFHSPVVNYILPSQALTVTSHSGQQYSIMDLTPYWGASLGGGSSFGNVNEGHGYVSMTIKNPNKQWNQNLTRGNTLNLTNWLGSGKNRRAKDSNNVPPEFNTQYNKFPWGVICKPCGDATHGCQGVNLVEYMAEVPYTTLIDTCNNFPGPYTVYEPSFGTDNFGNGVGSGWTDAINAGCGGTVQAKIAGPSPNYQQELNQCFDDGVKEVTIDLYKSEQKKTARKIFLSNKKQDVETGPFGISGFYPLYDTVEGARLNSPTFYASRDGENTYGYHIHQFGDVEYYMPNGLEMGVTQFHGDWDGTEIQEFSSIQENIVVQNVKSAQDQEEKEQEEQEEVRNIVPRQLPLSNSSQATRTSEDMNSGGGGGY
tara:strand:- start:147 stop:2669 length:2523 start_codon:yes stop_codon:yes gene_type:complete